MVAVIVLVIGLAVGMTDLRRFTAGFMATVVVVAGRTFGGILAAAVTVVAFRNGATAAIFLVTVTVDSFNVVAVGFSELPTVLGRAIGCFSSLGFTAAAVKIVRRAATGLMKFTASLSVERRITGEK